MTTPGTDTASAIKTALLLPGDGDGETVNVVDGLLAVAETVTGLGDSSGALAAVADGLFAVAHSIDNLAATLDRAALLR